MNRFSFFANPLVRIRQWWCGRLGHRAIAREWEWAISDPYWREREEWTCLRCQKEMGTNPPDQHERIPTRRPTIPDHVWELLDTLKDNPDYADVRFRCTGEL